MKVTLAVCVALLAVVLVQAADELAPPIRRGAAARITNGRPATPKLLPYMAYIEIPMSFGFTWYCAGSLITRSAVLTAASCVFSKKEYAVRLGSIYRREEDPNAWSVVSTRAMVHPKYNEASEDNNIAIIQLPRRAPLNEFIQRVYLPCSPDDSSYADHQAIVSGWGQTSHASEFSDVLLWAEVLLTHNDNCKQEFPNRAVTDRQLCAGNLSSAAYNGDYGAPLVIYNRGRYIQIGIFSDYGSRPYNTHLPALYTRVTSFMDWIKMTTESD